MVEVIFFLKTDDTKPPQAPPAVDLSNQTVFLCSSCIKEGAVQELVKTLMSKIQVDQKEILTYEVKWSRG